jgi:anti-anti-sigma regulatory factor
MKLYLIAATGKHRGMPIPIRMDLFLLGSDSACQLRSHLPGVGGQHCALVTRDKKVFVRDLGAGSETTVNGEVMPVGEEWPVQAGDRVAVGPLEFLVQFRDKPHSQQELEDWARRCLDRALDEDEDEDDGDEELLQTVGVRPVTASDAAAALLNKFQARKGIVRGHLWISQDEDTTAFRFNVRYLVEVSEIALVKKELMSHLVKPTPRVLLDFKNVRRLSAACGEMLLELFRDLQARGTRLALCRVRPEILPLLRTLKVLHHMPHFRTKETALGAKW